MTKKLVGVAIATMLMVSMLCAMLSGCHKQPDSTTAGMTQPPAQQMDITPGVKELDWTMQGAWVDANGKAGEKVELKLKGTVSLEQNGESTYRVTFTDPDGKIAYSVLGVLGSEYSYTCSHAMGTEKGVDSFNLKMYSAYIGFDYAKGCVIIDFDDDQDVYLIASIDAKVNLDQLWAYFQRFFDIRPKKWPVGGIG